MNKKAISILLTAAMGVSVLAAGTVTVSAAEKGQICDRNVTV